VADKIAFELVSPERLLVSEDVEMVVVPGAEGDFGVLIGHQPMISTVRPGILEIHNEGDEPRRIYVNGGFAEVTGDRCAVMTEEATPVEDMKRAEVEATIKTAEEDLTSAKTDHDTYIIQTRLATLRQIAASASA
jgi:F-type H+-transporting ATPase subunit epsilon